jgi:micrococcal nuclease
MTAKIFLITIISSLPLIASTDDKADNIPDSRKLRNYGGAVVEKFLEADGLYTFRCNIKDWPPIIGQDIPVMIKNIEPPTIVTDQKSPNIFFELQVKKFLENNLAKAKIVNLERIQRGESFCLIADVMLDGKNLSRLLIENDLAKHAREPKKNTKTRQNRRTKTSQTNTPQDRTSTAATKKQQQITGAFVASKNGKVFHKASCYHVKRISPENIVRFTTRDEAARSRRPCKTCSP